MATVQLLLNQRHRMTLDILRFDMFQFDFHDVLLLPGRAPHFSLILAVMPSASFYPRSEPGVLTSPRRRAP